MDRLILNTISVMKENGGSSDLTIRCADGRVSVNYVQALGCEEAEPADSFAADDVGTMQENLIAAIASTNPERVSTYDPIIERGSKLSEEIKEFARVARMKEATTAADDVLPAASPAKVRSPTILPDDLADEDGDDIEPATTRKDIASVTSSVRMTADEKAASLRSIIADLQDMAIDGQMPTVREWDANKDDEQPTASTIVARYDFSWRDLARYCRLAMTTNAGRKAKSKSGVAE